MYTEFIASLLETKGKMDEAKLADAFDQLDADHSGYISRADLKKILGNTWSAEYVDRLIKEADMDLDGQISYDEFKEYLAEKNAENIRLVCDYEDPILSSVDGDTAMMVGQKTDEAQEVPTESSAVGDTDMIVGQKTDVTQEVLN
jgi:hypothetical protein